MNICQNPECNKEIPEGKNCCDEQCLRRHLEIKKEAKSTKATYEQQSNPALDVELRSKLNNTAWQRGLSWRTEKIEAIAEARRRGIDEKEIFKQLKRAGLIDQTVKALMNDAHYFDE